MSSSTTRPRDPHLLRMTAYPPGGPYERWEVTVEETGELIIAGAWPIDEDAVRAACTAYHERIEGERISDITRDLS